MSDRDVAIIGISGVYPQAENLSEFYLNLSRGLDSVREIPRDRLVRSGLDPAQSYPVIASLDRPLSGPLAIGSRPYQLVLDRLIDLK